MKFDEGTEKDQEEKRWKGQFKAKTKKEKKNNYSERQVYETNRWEKERSIVGNIYTIYIYNIYFKYISPNLGRKMI